MFIELLGRGDRLGANITCFVAQILYAINKDFFIVYDKNFINHCDNVCFVPYNQSYNNSIFIKSLFYFIDIHNDNLEKLGFLQEDKVDCAIIHWFEMTSKVVLTVKNDFFTLFKSLIFPKINDYYKNEAIIKNYTNIFPFNPYKTILVHLRLGDCKCRPDYDGQYCANFFKNEINNDIIATNQTHSKLMETHPYNNSQSPLSKIKLENQISILKEKYPLHEVVIITEPDNNNYFDYPYRYIQNNDENYDLYLLSNCEVVVLSRSTFSLSSLFFNDISKDIYVPLWGHLPCMGLFTKYDNTHFQYF
jgi:hypothetical protein